MAGLVSFLDLLRKNPTLTSQSLQACGYFSAKAAASVAAVAGGAPYLYDAFRLPVAYCDAGLVLPGTMLPEDYISNLRSATRKLFQNDESLNLSTKEYNFELKPLYSAFEIKALMLTTLRSFLLFFLPLLEPRTNLEEDDDDFLQETEEVEHVDLVVPFKKSLKQIARETTVTTTRRILERIAVHHVVSQRMAWKLLKDLPKSAMRKAGRKMPTYIFVFSVSKSTLRGHMLGVAASWVISIGIDIYRTFSYMINSKAEVDEIETPQKLKILGKKISGTTIRCCASLIFASIGAGIGALLINPSSGQRWGCLFGDLAGPYIVAYCLERCFHEDIKQWD